MVVVFFLFMLSEKAGAKGERMAARFAGGARGTESFLSRSLARSLTPLLN